MPTTSWKTCENWEGPREAMAARSARERLLVCLAARVCNGPPDGAWVDAELPSGRAVFVLSVKGALLVPDLALGCRIAQGRRGAEREHQVEPGGAASAGTAGRARRPRSRCGPSRGGGRIPAPHPSACDRA